MAIEYVKLARKVDVYKLYGDLSWNLERVPVWVARLMFEGKLRIRNGQITYDIGNERGNGNDGDYIVRYSSKELEYVTESDFHTYFGRREVSE